MLADRQLVSLAVSVGLCFCAAAIGATATTPTMGSWYAELAKPAWTPPASLFGPVWTVLYLTMAIAAWWVWLRRDHPGARIALTLYAVQLVLNALWSPIFFGWRQPGWALLDIALLWLALLATVWTFLRVNRLAGWLLVPYLLWTSYAAALNAAIWRMNA